MVTMPDFGFDGVSSSLAKFMSIFLFNYFFQLFLKYFVRNPDTDHRQQTAHGQCRVRATTS